MSHLRVERLWKGHGGQPVLRGLDLEVPSGAILALLGGSGSGKTTLLRQVAGFEAAESGRITLGERVLQDGAMHVPAERRRIGYVPQEGTLFPHLTVAGNVGFGLPRGERRGARVDEMLRLTGLEAFAGRFPHQLSGGQQQRTALARALAPRPALILLDEPFNALDLDLRRSVCADVTAALRAAGATALLVTHDPQEAFASADRLAVMVDGLVVQNDDPATVYHRPASAEVARLTGDVLFVEAAMRDGVAITALGPLAVGGDGPAGRAVVLLRPEQMRRAAPGEGQPAVVVARGFRGDHTLVTVRVGEETLRFRLADPAILDESAPLRLAVAGPGVAFPAGREA